jgi:hypothetical protein
MSNFVQIDDSKLIKKMKKYEQVVGKEVEQLVKNAARLCAIECMRYTGPRGTKAADKRRSESNIKKDLRGIFTIVNPKWWQAVMDMGKDNREVLVHEKTSIVWARDTQDTIDSVEGARTFHKANKASGKTTRLGMLDRAIIKQSVYRKYLKEVFAKVGIAKAGWASAAQKCEADVREPMKGIPAWVERNISNSPSAVSNHKGVGMSRSVKMTNKVRYSREVLDAGNEAFAINLAKKKMMSMMNHAIRYVKTKEAELA